MSQYTGQSAAGNASQHNGNVYNNNYYNNTLSHHHQLPPQPERTTTLNTQLNYAAGAGQLHRVKYLLERVTDIDSKDAEGWTALHEAANAGHNEIVEILVLAGADINALTNERKTPMHYATSGGLTRPWTPAGQSLIAFLREHGAVLTGTFAGGVEYILDLRTGEAYTPSKPPVDSSASAGNSQSQGSSSTGVPGIVYSTPSRTGRDAIPTHVCQVVRALSDLPLQTKAPPPGR